MPSRCKLKTSAAVLKNLVLPCAAVGAGVMCGKGVQTAETIPDPVLQEAVKSQYSLSSSGVSFLLMTYGVWSFIEALCQTQAWKYLTMKQRVAVCFCITTGVGWVYFLLAVLVSQSIPAPPGLVRLAASYFLA